MSEPLHDIFFDIMTTKRNELPVFLEKHGNYDMLVKICRELEKKHGRNIIEKMLLGTVGYESNKQRAIYVLPTIELLQFLYSLIIILNINLVEEITAGQGLLSCMLNNYIISKNTIGFHTINVVATDTNKWLESSGPKYYPVELKLLDQFEHNYNKKMCIMIWPDNLTINNSTFGLFMATYAPECFILIGKYDLYKSALDIINRCRYNIKEFNIKHISHCDYFEHNIDSALDVTQSSIYVCTKEINSHNISMTTINNVLEDILMVSTNIYSMPANTEQHKLYNYVHNKIFPTWILGLDNDKIINFMKKIREFPCGNIVRCDMLECCRDVIQSYDEFIYYINCMVPRVPIFKNHTKFLEFRTLMDKLHMVNGLATLVNEGIIPEWITRMEDAEVCLCLDYDKNIDRKKWKTNPRKFMEECRNYFDVSEQ